MLSVDEAVARIKKAFMPLASERVALSAAANRVLAVDVLAGVDQPAHAVSAMDGYAVRLADADVAGASLRVIGTAPAGHPFQGNVSTVQAVRIFTGAVVPKGADAILIQENAEARDGADPCERDRLPDRPGTHAADAGAGPPGAIQPATRR